jgi:alpha-beta hydrolase superfamily lysophospholipase
MGSAAILKYLNDHKENPKGIILECPFGSLYTTTCARFSNMKVPSFPAAGVLLFWGGVQNWFWPFSHNPTDYAKNVKCPALLLYGSHDDRVSLSEITEIANNLKNEKKLIVYPHLGHNDLFGGEWKEDVSEFVNRYAR